MPSAGKFLHTIVKLGIFRLVLMNVQFKTDVMVNSKVVLISYAPDNSGIKDKTIQSQSFMTLKKETESQKSLTLN